jgi:hypothetical protein
VSGRREIAQQNHKMTMFCTATSMSVLILTAAFQCAAASAVAPALKIDLDASDAMKTNIALVNGQPLAYVQLGSPVGKAAVLIHGYTDNARDWVPLAP